MNAVHFLGHADSFVKNPNITQQKDSNIQTIQFKYSNYFETLFQKIFFEKIFVRILKYLFKSNIHLNIQIFKSTTQFKVRRSNLTEINNIDVARFKILSLPCICIFVPVFLFSSRNLLLTFSVNLNN